MADSPFSIKGLSHEEIMDGIAKIITERNRYLPTPTYLYNCLEYLYNKSQELPLWHSPSSEEEIYENNPHPL